MKLVKWGMISLALASGHAIATDAANTATTQHVETTAVVEEVTEVVESDAEKGRQSLEQFMFEIQLLEHSNVRYEYVTSHKDTLQHELDIIELVAILKLFPSDNAKTMVMRELKNVTKSPNNDELKALVNMIEGDWGKLEVLKIY